MSHQDHLTDHQLSEVLIASLQESSLHLEILREHLRDCTVCNDRLISLRRPLTLFRSTTTAWADQTSARRTWTPPLLLARPASSRHLTRWMLTAAALLLAAAIPLALHDHPFTPPHTGVATSSQPHARPSTPIGDEALLEEVNQTLSSSIPTPMQPLADPTAGRSNQIDSASRKN
jgi:hypothetical protein